MRNTSTLLTEAKKKHREVKGDILELLGVLENPRTTMEQVKNKLFKIYTKVK